MNRKDFQKLTSLRLREARALLNARCYSGAYYLAGYAVECALKACIARQTQRHDFPHRNAVRDSYTHDLVRLAQTAGVYTALDKEGDASPAFALNWTTVKDWKAESRYEVKSEDDAGGLLTAITARQHGVLKWIRQYW